MKIQLIKSRVTQQKSAQREIYNIKCQYWWVERKLQNQSSKLLPQETRKKD